MRSFALFVEIIIVALAPCILGQPPPPPPGQIPAINDSDMHGATGKLMDEIFEDWEQEVAHEPDILPMYERWHHAFEEAYMERANMAAGSRTFRALQGRFTGDGAPVKRVDVVRSFLIDQNGLSPTDVTTASNRLLNAETHEEFTDEVAEATANALMEVMGNPVPGAGDNSYTIIDFEPRQITAMFAMALFPGSGR